MDRPSTPDLDRYERAKGDLKLLNEFFTWLHAHDVWLLYPSPGEIEAQFVRFREIDLAAVKAQEQAHVRYTQWQTRYRAANLPLYPQTVARILRRAGFVHHLRATTMYHTSGFLVESEYGKHTVRIMARYVEPGESRSRYNDRSTGDEQRVWAREESKLLRVFTTVLAERFDVRPCTFGWSTFADDPPPFIDYLRVARRPVDVPEDVQER